MVRRDTSGELGVAQGGGDSKGGGGGHGGQGAWARVRVSGERAEGERRGQRACILSSRGDRGQGGRDSGDEVRRQRGRQRTRSLQRGEDGDFAKTPMPAFFFSVFNSLIETAVFSI